MVAESRFSLQLSKEQIEQYYRGDIGYVQVKDQTGREIRFPLDRIKPYITRDGIVGEFALRYDENNRFLSLEKISD